MSCRSVTKKEDCFFAVALLVIATEQILEIHMKVVYIGFVASTMAMVYPFRSVVPLANDLIVKMYFFQE